MGPQADLRMCDAALQHDSTFRQPILVLAADSAYHPHILLQTVV